MPMADPHRPRPEGMTQVPSTGLSSGVDVAEAVRRLREKDEVGRGYIEAAACRQAGPELIDDPLGGLVFEKFHAAR